MISTFLLTTGSSVSSLPLVARGNEVVEGRRLSHSTPTSSFTSCVRGSWIGLFGVYEIQDNNGVLLDGATSTATIKNDVYTSSQPRAYWYNANNPTTPVSTGVPNAACTEISWYDQDRSGAVPRMLSGPGSDAAAPVATATHAASLTIATASATSLAVATAAPTASFSTPPPPTRHHRFPRHRRRGPAAALAALSIRASLSLRRRRRLRLTSSSSASTSTAAATTTPAAAAAGAASVAAGERVPEHPKHQMWVHGPDNRQVSRRACIEHLGSLPDEYVDRRRAAGAAQDVQSGGFWLLRVAGAQWQVPEERQQHTHLGVHRRPLRLRRVPVAGREQVLRHHDVVEHPEQSE